MAGQEIIHKEKTESITEKDLSLTPDSTAEVQETRTGLHESDAVLANAPWQFKAIALITALMLPVGSHFSNSALGAMKATLKAELQIDNTKYGVLTSAVSIINTIFPILGGFFIDVFGSFWGTLAINFMIFLGSMLTAISAKVESFPLMVVAQVVFGIGSGLIVTMQETLLSKWFRTKYLALAIGLQLSISRLSTFLGTLVSNPIAERTNDWVWAFWLALILCGYSVMMNIAYAFILKHLQGSVMTTSEIMRLKAKKTVNFKSVFRFPAYFWLVILIEFIFAAVWSVHQDISTELVQIHFGDTAKLAGYKASASQSVPIVTTPVLGIFMDVFGNRVTILNISAIFFIVSCGLLGWTYVEPLAGMILYSFSLALGPISMITSIGMILPSDYIGTGLGMYKAANNIGTSILGIVVGVVQDHTEGERYEGVMTVFIVLGAIGFLLIIGLFFVQRKYLNNLLQITRRKREARMKEKNDHELELAQQGLDTFSVVKPTIFNYIYVAAFVICGLCAWVLFFVFAATKRVVI